MGDLVQSTPLFAGLREKYPGAKIAVMVSSDFQEFARRVPGIDELIVLDIRQFMGRQPPASWIDVYQYLEAFLERVKTEGNYDLLINLSHSRLSALMTRVLGIADVRGFACNDVGERVTHHPWMQYFGIEPFNRRLNPFNLVEIYLRSGDLDPQNRVIVLEPAHGEPPADTQLDFGDDEILIGLQAGSSLKGRRWPAERFAELADQLIERLGARVLLFGVSSESKLAETIQNAMRHRERAVDLTGKTSIDQLMHWLGRVRLLVSNDTGTLHIAAALGTPVVGLYFAHAHPYETGPFHPGSLVFQARIPCAPCSYAVECENVVCVDKVRPRLVGELIETWLREKRWRLEREDGLEEVDIYETRWGGDGRCVLAPLIRRPPTIEDVARTAYEILWPHFLCADEPPPTVTESLAVRLQAHYDCGALETLRPGLEAVLAALMELAGLAREGITVARAVAGWKPGEGQSLDTLGGKLASIDERLIHAGCVHEEIKPLADLYVKRKENHQGEDIAGLAQANEEDYRRLRSEAQALYALIEEVVQEIGDSSTAGEPVDSMSTWVPVR